MDSHCTLRCLRGRLVQRLQHGFAFTLGTRFAVSDVETTERRTRRVALFHGIVTFFHNTAILALVRDELVRLSGTGLRASPGFAGLRTETLNATVASLLRIWP